VNTAGAENHHNPDKNQAGHSDRYRNPYSPHKNTRLFFETMMLSNPRAAFL